MRMPSALANSGVRVFSRATPRARRSLAQFAPSWSAERLFFGRRLTRHRQMPFDIEASVQAVAWMLFGAALLGMLAFRFRVPYAVALVLGSLLVEETTCRLPQRSRACCSSSSPPLLFDAAFQLDVAARAVARQY